MHHKHHHDRGECSRVPIPTPVLLAVPPCLVIMLTIHSTPQVAAGVVTPPPIGKPVPNMQCYILDPYQQPVPVGVYGELFLGTNL